MQPNINFLMELGRLLKQAEYAAKYPEEERKHRWWSDLPQEKKDILLQMYNVGSGRGYIFDD